MRPRSLRAAAARSWSRTPDAPAVRYARSGEVNIAYQVVGEGAIDLVVIPIWVSHLEYAWEEPSLARFYRRLASFSRLVLLDKRGTGLSDRPGDGALQTLEERMDDVRAVLDAVGSEQAALFGMHDGGTMAALFAATYPERTLALTAFGMFARRLRAPGYEHGWEAGRRQEWIREIEQTWGGAVGLAEVAPSVAGDPRFERWWATYLRLGASPGAAVALARMNDEIDIRDVLPAIHVPTLLLHRVDDRRVGVAEARAIAEAIPAARLVELPGADHLPWVGDQDAVLDELEEFLTGARRAPDPHRILATVLSPTSSARPSAPSSWATGAGASSWSGTTRMCAASSPAGTVARSTTPATGSSRPSTALRVRFAARSPSARR